MTRKTTLLLSAALLSAGAAHAQANYKVDSTFGADGIFSNPEPGLSTDTQFGRAQADGKIVVGGSFGSSTEDSSMVFRLKTNGTPDSSFGVNGYARVRFASTAPGIAADVAPLANGKIAVLGESAAAGIRTVTLAMLNANGSADASFNGGQPITLGPSGISSQSGRLAIQSNGKVVASFTVVGTPPNTTSYTTVSRYNTNGTIDATFGTNGSLTITPGFTYDMKMDGNDRLYLNWTNTAVLPLAERAIYRLTANGQLDASWGTGGKSDTVMANTASNLQLSFTSTLLPNGKVMMSLLGTSGAATSATKPLTTVRYTATGQRDMTYGSSGKAVTNISGFNSSSTYYTAANGAKILMLLRMPSVSANARDAVLVQIDSNGALDNSFGTMGMLRTTVGPGAQARTLSKLPDGTLIGTAGIVDSKGFVVRYKQTPTGMAVINSKMEAAVYPNPATSSIMLRCEPGVLYALYDMTGREVSRGTTHHAETPINLERFAAGTYSLICTDRKRNAELTVVKQ